jgi:hypothetical protein
MSKIFRTGALAAALAALPLTAAFADRAPTAQENAEIGNVLFTEGFTSWGKIEFDDDGMWTVENAIDQDGNSRDLTLDTALFIVDSDEDTDGGEIVGIHPVD